MKPTANVSSPDHRAGDKCSASWNYGQKQEKEYLGECLEREGYALPTQPFRVTETANYT